MTQNTLKSNLEIAQIADFFESTDRKVHAYNYLISKYILKNKHINKLQISSINASEIEKEFNIKVDIELMNSTIKNYLNYQKSLKVDLYIYADATTLLIEKTYEVKDCDENTSRKELLKEYMKYKIAIYDHKLTESQKVDAKNIIKSIDCLTCNEIEDFLFAIFL